MTVKAIDVAVSFTYLHGVLVLAREGVDGTLLDTLLTLAKALVPRDRWISRDISRRR